MSPQKRAANRNDTPGFSPKVSALGAPKADVHTSESSDWPSLVATAEPAIGGPGKTMSSKQFGLKLDELVRFSDTDLNIAAILRADIPKSSLSSFEFSNNIDPFIFKSGVLTVQTEQIELLNSLIKGIEHAY